MDIEQKLMSAVDRSLFLANQMVNVRAFGHSGNHQITALPPGLASALGDGYDAIVLALPDLEKQLDQVRSDANARRKG